MQVRIVFFLDLFLFFWTHNSIGANVGQLYLMDQAFLFLEKPPLAFMYEVHVYVCMRYMYMCMYV